MPFIIAFSGMIGQPKSRSAPRSYVLTGVFLLPVLTYSLLGSPYATILLTAAGLAMMIAASFDSAPILLAALTSALAIGLSLGPQNFLTAGGFAAARLAEAHTDFVLAHFHEKSIWLAALGLFLALALISQVGMLLREVRGEIAKTAVVGHLAILSFSIVWSVLANLGYVAMPGSGTPLPFVSYGGSFLIGQLALIGLSAGHFRRRSLSLIYKKRE